MTIAYSEKRRFPRIEKELPLKIRTNECDLVTQTKNISCIGAYCSINRYIRPLTKLSIILLLPSMTKYKNKTFRIQCKGVVVRIEQRSHHGFDIAIFFNDITQRDKEKISKYVTQYIS